MNFSKLSRKEIEQLRPEHVRPKVLADQAWGEELLLGVFGEYEAIARVTRHEEAATVALSASARSSSHGPLAAVETLLIRGSECSFRCVMCDLWKSTHEEDTPENAIAKQVEAGVGSSSLTDFRAAVDTQVNCSQRWLKLYNASNFFAERNVPQTDRREIAKRLAGYDRVIVENHPRLSQGKEVLEFAELIDGKLEVAMGLETIHKECLASLNKGMRLKDFDDACDFLAAHQIDTRAFLLLRPPGMTRSMGVEWCVKAVEYAEERGVRHVTIIPTRSGNGAIEHLATMGQFRPPEASDLEEAAALAFAQTSNIVVNVDLWDWERLNGTCGQCQAARSRALNEFNLSQDGATANRIASPIQTATGALMCGCGSYSSSEKSSNS